MSITTQKAPPQTYLGAARLGAVRPWRSSLDVPHASKADAEIFMAISIQPNRISHHSALISKAQDSLDAQP